MLPHQQGWTLLELILVLALGATILLIPVSAVWQGQHRLHAYNLCVQALQHDLQTARLLAALSASPVSLAMLPDSAGPMLAWQIKKPSQLWSKNSCPLSIAVIWQGGLQQRLGPVFLPGGRSVLSPGRFTLYNKQLHQERSIIISKSGRARVELPYLLSVAAYFRQFAIMAAALNDDCKRYYSDDGYR